jgi:hypothetical protein
MAAEHIAKNALSLRAFAAWTPGPVNPKVERPTSLGWQDFSVVENPGCTSTRLLSDTDPGSKAR